jgi:hypothetical protein
MAIDNGVGLWNENAGAVYNAREYRRFLERMMGYDVITTPGTGSGGTFRPTDLAPTQAGTPNMTVLVAAGAVYVEGSESATQGGYFVYNDAQTVVTVPAANATNPRIDIIGVRIEDSEYSGANNTAAIVLVSGVAAASPVEPTLPANFMTICRVDVAASAVSITNANITDRRRRMAAVGGIIPCTSTTRPSVSLWEGMFIYETDTHALKQYTTATTLWQPPWNLAWGRQGSVTWTSDASANPGPTTVTASAVTWTAVANRVYKYTLTYHSFSSVAGDTGRLTVVDTGGTGKGTPSIQDNISFTANQADQRTFISQETGVAAGSTTRRHSLLRTAGTGVVHLFADVPRPAMHMVEDVGPNGAPA